MIFTFICFLTSMIFWLVLVLTWRALYPGRARAATPRSGALHERAMHSLPSLIGLLCAPLLLMLVLLSGYLVELELVDARMIVILAAAFFVSGHYLVRAARGFF